MRFFKLNTKGRRILIKIGAGLTAVMISPPLASLLNSNTGIITSLWQNEISALELQNAPPALEMNRSSLLLYKPPEAAKGGDSALEYNIIPEKLHIPIVYDYPLPDEVSLDDPAAAMVMSQNISDVREDDVQFTEIDGRIVKTTFKPSGSTFVGLDLAGQVRNDTELSNDFVLEQSRILPEIKLELNGEPEILILHTHTTEAFQPDKYDFYDANYNSRSSDSEQNIVAVGAEMARSFAEAGITVIHDGTIHDVPFSGAYVRSADTVRQILKAYPSVKVVLDVHRDAIDRSDGARLAPVTNVNGKDAAQVMIISAADDGTYDMPHYLRNFHLASLFQQYMEHDCEGITRPIWFQYCQYNQHLSTGSLLVEVGSHGNTLEEAKYTGRLIGKSMAEALLSL